MEDNEEYLRPFGDAANCCDCGVCEMFACPMGLSPRKVNGYIKGSCATGIQVPGTWSPSPGVCGRRKTPPTGWWPGWACRPADGLPRPPCPWNDVFIPFQRHIGKPAVPVKAVGDPVSRASFWLRPPRTACAPTSRQHRRRGEKSLGRRRALPEGGMKRYGKRHRHGRTDQYCPGIETSDFMVKAAQVDLIRSSTVCPGKYIILIAGDTGDVKSLHGGGHPPGRSAW